MKGRLATGLAAAVFALAAPLIMHFEGRSLNAYPDAGGVPTICDGITQGVHLGDVATPAECDAKLRDDLAHRLAALHRCINVALTPNQWAALLSLAYNVGVGAVCSSTMVRLINSGAEPAEWCRQFTDAKNSMGERVGFTYGPNRTRLPGLIRRRAAERRICEQ